MDSLKDRNLDIRKMVLFLMWQKEPEQIFGPLSFAKGNYRYLAKLMHTDTKADGVPDDAITKLNLLWADAEELIAADKYGGTRVTNTVKIKDDDYLLIHLSGSDDIADSWKIHDGWVMRIPHEPSSNDLMNDEKVALELLNQAEGFDKIVALIPKIKGSLLAKTDGEMRRINILDYSGMSTDVDNLLTLRQIGEYYQNKLHPKHIAWIWRKILFALDFAHYNGVTHGGLIPHNILIEPVNHLVTVSGWQFSTLNHAPFKAVSSAEGNWYPAEINHRDYSTFGIDFYTAGKSMLWAGESEMPDSMKAYFKWVATDSTLGRPQSAQSCLSEFDALIAQLWGKREFFPMSDLEWPLFPEEG